MTADNNYVELYETYLRCPKCGLLRIIPATVQNPEVLFELTTDFAMDHIALCSVNSEPITPRNPWGL